MSLKLSDDQVYGILEVADELFQAGAYNDLIRHVRAVSNLRKHLRALVLTTSQSEDVSGVVVDQ